MRLFATVSVGLLFGSAVIIAPRVAAAAPTVAVQPVSVQALDDGPAGISVRHQVARIVRGKGFRVNTSIPQATGTSQYLTWAVDHAVTAFVVADLETWGKGKYQKVTFLVWNGRDGSVIGRWSVAGPTRKLWKSLAKDFWKRLGPAIERAQAPPEAEPLGPGPTQHIDASSAYDDSIVSQGTFRRRR